MIREYQIRVLPQQAAGEAAIRGYLAREQGIDARTIKHVRVLKKSIDARQRTIYVNLKVRVYINEMPDDDEYVHTEYRDVSGARQVVVVGAGPGGLFASLRLIEHGLKPVLIERGKDVRERKKDLADITRTHKVDAESNYCFGEGGAGAYSDGKLYTRSKKRGNIDKILNVFCQHGASTSILYDAHPHIGTDKLPGVIENMRNTILRCGGEVHFMTRMERLLVEGDTVVGVEATDLNTGAGREFRGPVILATGHSARDVYRYLCAVGVDMEPKGLAIGVRLEHPADMIDRIQYHNKEGRGRYLPAAEYSFVTQVDGRGVYSFCMCPGGFVIPAATGPQQIVVNGMSPSNRGTQWSNSGMVVEVRPEDVLNEELRMKNEESLGNEELRMKNEESCGNGELRSESSDFRFNNEELRVGNMNFNSALPKDSSFPQDSSFFILHSSFPKHSSFPLRMLCFQERLERACWQQGNMRQTAPAQRMADFVNSRLSYDLPKSSYAPGLISSPLHFWMPDMIVKRLQQGFLKFGRMSHGFLTNEAVMIGVETRTSSPVRILRDRDTLQHVRLKGLFPCGEGAGYAGGIVSAGVDGERCADMAAGMMNAL